MAEKNPMDDNPHWVAVYGIVKQDDKVLFLRRQNTDYMAGYFGLPSGKIAYAESALQALQREIREEIGITIDPAKAVLCHTSHRFEPHTKRASWVDFYFQITEWDGTITNAEPEKCSEIAWLPIGTTEPVVPYVSDILKKINNNETLSVFGDWAEPQHYAA